MSKKPYDPVKVQGKDFVSGRRLIGGDFSSSVGRRMGNIVDNQGRVFEPNPYDIPQNPHKIGHFSVTMLLAMIDTGLLTEEFFATREEYFAFRGHLTTLRNVMGFFSGISIEKQRMVWRPGFQVRRKKSR